MLGSFDAAAFALGLSNAENWDSRTPLTWRALLSCLVSLFQLKLARYPERRRAAHAEARGRLAKEIDLNLRVHAV